MKRAFVYIILGAVIFSGGNLLVRSVQADQQSVISFLSNENSNFDIFLIDTDGKVRQRLATDAVRKSVLTCSPFGYQFAFQSNKNANLDIYKMNIRNKNLIRLTHHPERDLWPAWAPNGKWIAFVSERMGTQDIYRMDIDGSNVMRLTIQGLNGRPAWSPDSQLIAYDSDRDVNHSIYIMNADGEQVKQVTGDLPLWRGCDWSPDGKQIVFVSGNLMEEGVDIHTIGIDGENLQKLTAMGRETRTGNPAWSPDGKWIAFSVAKVNEWPNPANGFSIIFGDSTIYIVDSKGNDNGRPLEETKGLSSDHVPVWTSEDFFLFPQMKIYRSSLGEHLNNRRC